MSIREEARRFHSFLASGISQDGHFTFAWEGRGSFLFIGLLPLPRSPSSSFRAVGRGFLPFIAKGISSNLGVDIYLFCVYTISVIKTFADHETEKVFHQQFSRKLDSSIQKVALRKLMMIDNAESLNDLRVPPNNRLEALHGDREGQHSIRINDQYRICFREENGNYYDVEICDYH